MEISSNDTIGIKFAYIYILICNMTTFETSKSKTLLKMAPSEIMLTLRRINIVNYVIYNLTDT